MTRRRARWLLLCLSFLACQNGGIPKEDLPDAPIAFTYRTPEEARRRADAWKDAQDKQVETAREQIDPEAQAAESSGEIRPSVAQMRDLFGKLVGHSEEQDAQYPGRLALLDPHTGAITVVDAARRGSIPLAWSADHSRLLFAQPGERDFQIFEYERATGTVRPITHGPPAHTQACYAGGERIVAIAAEAQSGLRSRVEVSGAGGGGPYTPLSDWGMVHSPSCAPDGSAVVWTTDTENGRPDLILRQPIDGGENRMLAPGRFPHFSADGGWIVYCAPLKAEWRVWRMRADGTGRAPVGFGARTESRPTLSPDGRYVAYVAAEEAPRHHLYLRRFDGSGDRILFADGDGEYPVW